MPGTVLAVTVGRITPATGVNRDVGTAIDKRPVSGPVAVGPLGVAGDEHGDPVGHGGEYQAVYAYAQEDADFWAAELDRQVLPGAFGENLRTAGLDVSGAVTGETWRVGAILVEVTTPRIPCVTFAGFWGVPQLVKRFTRAARPGAYLKVLEPGEIAAGDPIEVVSRPEHGVTVADLLRTRSGDRSLLPRIRQLPGLAPKWRSWLESIDEVKATG